MKKHIVCDKISKYTSIFEIMVLTGQASDTYERSLNVEKKFIVEETSPTNETKYICNCHSSINTKILAS